VVKRIALRGMPLREKRFEGWPAAIHRVLFGGFVLQLGLVMARFWMPHLWFGEAHWPDGLLVVLAAAATLAWLTTQLPGQNVMLAGIIIGFIAGAIESVGALTGVPFGPKSFTSNIGQELFHPLPWAMPVVWLILVLNARGVARLLLKPWRRTPNYGFWLIGLASGLVAFVQLGLDPYANRVKHFWIWAESKTSLQWYTAPWVNFISCLVTATIILAFATPSLINKSPAKTPPSPDWQPLALWLLLNALLAAGALANQLWPAAIVVLVGSAAIAAIAVWNGRI